MSLFNEVSTSCVDFPLISPLMSSLAKHMRFGACVCGSMASIGCWCVCVRSQGFHWVLVHVCAVVWFFRPGDASASLGFLPFHLFCVCFSAVANTKKKVTHKRSKKTQTKEHRGKCVAKFSFSVVP